MQNERALPSRSSNGTTEQYHAPWNTARRDRLVGIVRKVYARDPTLLSLDGRIHDNINTGGVAATRVQQPGAHPGDTKLIG
ncbi:MAG: hypothetical protein OXL36_03215 [Bryobacterales bacterium]|nr:hypothetical protein [Bryobacterales bacterium]